MTKCNLIYYYHLILKKKKINLFELVRFLIKERRISNRTAKLPSTYIYRRVFTQAHLFFFQPSPAQPSSIF